MTPLPHALAKAQFEQRLREAEHARLVRSLQAEHRALRAGRRWFPSLRFRSVLDPESSADPTPWPPPVPAEAFEFATTHHSATKD